MTIGSEGSCALDGESRLRGSGPGMSPVTVAVAMSGVDSSTAAALLRGYNVIGLTMKLWSDAAAEGVARDTVCGRRLSPMPGVAKLLGSTTMS